ncbi:hypothetical protein DYB30_001139 [Aphanomyces astaci]|uniref:Riboflavin synthase n=1 Tax=Aphanomyces astaci TaxID=112090 RepID=A0A397E1E6_APHAT|nr:hypothetical protein DYB30_001139 [Aphanomyces astaci]RHY90240.1 hypothetical protein DYB26_000322 [Aphanomyces astaci]RHZ13544.1 hypothetical protein DYB31_000646 [Aphanomyces astaci]
MFTGIIEEIGTVVSRVEKDDMQMWDGSVAKGTVLVVRLKVALDGAYIGCSIAINGTCLTATDIDRDTGHVSLRLTNLRVLEAGDKVNVERAMGAQDRNSGHFVQGHVDGTGKILELTKEGESLWVKIQAELSLLAHVVPKGFIAIDGTSLTVCEVNSRQGWFNVMLITHTQQSIVLPTKSVGDLVNLEGDVIGKYAAKSTNAFALRLESLEKTQRNALLAAGIVGGAIGAAVALVATHK